MQVPPGNPGDELDRAVVVRRAEAAGDEADVRLEALAQCRLELVRVVADDRNPDGLQPEQERLPGVEGAVEVGSLPPYELAARDDDRGPGTPQEPGEILRRPLAGTFTRAPATRTTTFRGDASVSESLRSANLFVWPRSSVPR